MLFRDHADAAYCLSEALHEWRGKNPLILAIPRCAGLMGTVIAKELGGELNIFLTHELRASGHSEFVVGVVSELGWATLAEYAASADPDEEYLRNEITTQLGNIRQRRAQYIEVAPPINPNGRIVIVVDDGFTTSATMIAMLRDVYASEPSWVSCAIPLASPNRLRKLLPYADEIICPHASPIFGAVSAFYANFAQMADDEVIAALRATGQRSEVEFRARVAT